mgnify:CR=1 FL=1
MDPNTIATIALAGVSGAVAVAVWALRLEGRMNTHEKTDDVIHTHVKESLDELKETTKSMDGKIDKILQRGR